MDAHCEAAYDTGARILSPHLVHSEAYGAAHLLLDSFKDHR